MRDPVNMRSSIYNPVCSSITVSQSISLSFFLFSHVLYWLLWKEPYDQRQNPNPFINQSSWFLFYLYLYFILLSLPIIIINKSLDFIKSQLNHHNISNESLIKLIRQLILTITIGLPNISQQLIIRPQTSLII